MPPRRRRINRKKSAEESQAVQEESRETSASPDEISREASNSREESLEKMDVDLPITQEPTQIEASEEVQEEEGDDDSDEDDGDSSPIELMVTKRARRSTAGNKMAALMATADHEDEFYKTAYGGFENSEADKAFESPVHSDDDEVDSDFDKSEDEDEAVSGDENDEDRPRKRKKFKEPKRGLTADDILAKNRKWAMSRLSGNIVAANAVDEKTQANLLKEAEITEKINIESLKKYEAFELEKKRKRERANVRIFPPGPREKIKMTAEGTTVTRDEFKIFECERPKARNVCAVTGRPAKYSDPVTGLPYSTPYAFKVIRDRYHKYLMTLEGNEEVTAYLKRLRQYPTPPGSPSAPAALNSTSIVVESSLST